MDLQLARVRQGHPDGCDLVYLDVDVSERAAYGSSVLDTIRIRRDDLVAVDVSADPPEIVWRWWHGTIESVDEARETAECRRPVANETGSAVKAVQLPSGLRDAARPGTSVWFGSDGDELIAVAIGGHLNAARNRLDQVRAAYE